MRTPDDIYDELLVLRCQEGDADALVELVERWRPRRFRPAAAPVLRNDGQSVARV